MNIDFRKYGLPGGIRAKLDELGIPYDTEKKIIYAPLGTTERKDDYGKVYTLPDGVLIQLLGFQGIVWVEKEQPQ